jgi:rod shape-determining protein MreB
MVVDVGGGTSEVAVISLGGIVVSRSLRVGGYDLDDAITNHLRLDHRMAVGSQSAEAIKLAIGSAAPLPAEESYAIRGRDLQAGLPREIELDSVEVRTAIASPLNDIMAAVHDTLEETPPELASDIARDGILLAGGGTLIRGFADLVGDETGMPVFSAQSPLTCVAFGSGQALDHFDQLTLSSRNRRPVTTPDWRTA